jgi:hypothetical protein
MVTISVIACRALARRGLPTGQGLARWWAHAPARVRGRLRGSGRACVRMNNISFEQILFKKSKPMMKRMTTKKKEGSSGLSMIKPTSFYSTEREKTKLNWFCYELSLGIYDDLKDNIGKQQKKHKISDERLAEFSIYISKKMIDIILQKLSGRIEAVYFSYEMIESYFPNIEDKFINKMLDSISKTWDMQLSFCEICPTRCISEKDEYCTMFNDIDLFK